MSKPGTVGELRELIAQLPDDARILPDWSGYLPGDEEPGVTIEGLSVGTDDLGDYLSVGVSLFYLNRDDDEDDEEQCSCGIARSQWAESVHNASCDRGESECDDDCAEHAPGCDGFCDHYKHTNACMIKTP